MLIDCDTCTARPRACGDCIVTHLLSSPPAARPADGHPDPVLQRPAADLTASEIAAVGVLSAGGLVPPLRLVTRSGSPPAAAGAARAAGRDGRSRPAGSHAG